MRKTQSTSLAAPSPTYLRILVFLLRLAGFKFATVSQALSAGFGRFVCLTFDGAPPELAKETLPVLSERGVPATVFVTTKGTLALKHLAPLKTAGWEVGSLGHDLVDLTTLGYQEQRRSVSRSRTLLEGKQGLRPKVFAYPFGAYDASTVSGVKDEGFTAALTLRSGVNDEASEPLQLRRLPLRGTLLADLVLIAKAWVVSFRQKATVPATRSSEQDSVRQGVAL